LRAPVALRHQAGELLASHQPLDPLATDADAAVPQRPVDPAGTVGLAALGVDLADPLDQPGVGQLTIRRCAPLPGVEAGAGDAEHPTEQRDGVVGLLRRG
jgi:hypothetical protein